MKRGPGLLGSFPQQGFNDPAPHALSPFSETGPSDSPFGNRRATAPSGSSLFSAPFGAAPTSAPPREPSPFAPDEDDGGPHSGPALAAPVNRGGLFSSSPFGAPASEGNDEPPIPSYALGRRTSVSAESLVPQNHRSQGPGLESTMEEDEDTPNPGSNSTPHFPKSDEQLSRIKAAIKPNFLFRNLDEEQERDVLAAMKEVSIGAGEMIIEQGAAGDYFYVVERGTLEVFVKKDGQMIDTEKGDKQLLGKKVATCKEGNSFGELALMHK